MVPTNKPKAEYPTVHPQPPQPSKPAKPFPTPTPQPYYNPKPVYQAKPIIDSVHGKPVFDARTLFQQPEIIGGRKYYKLWLVDVGDFNRQVSFDDPNTASTKKSTFYAKKKAFVSNPSALPMATLERKKYWVVNARLHKLITTNTSTPALIVPVYGNDANMFNSMTSSDKENFPLTNYTQEKFVVTRDDGMLWFVMIFIVMVALAKFLIR